MFSIPITTTATGYAPPPTGAEFDFQGTGYSSGSLVVYNASVFLQIKRGSSQGQSSWGAEFAIGPSALTLSAGASTVARPYGSELIFGVRARTFTSDVPWNAGATYAVGDTVTLSGVGYVAIAASTGQQPPNATFWQALAPVIFGSFFQPGEVSLSATAQSLGTLTPAGVVTNPSLETTDGVTVVDPTHELLIGSNIVLTSPAAGVARIDGGPGVTFGLPAIVLGTAAAPGAISEAIRRDSTIVAFDATLPAAEVFGGAGSVGTAAVAARRDHVHPMPSPPVGILAEWSGQIPTGPNVGVERLVPPDQTGASLSFNLFRAKLRIALAFTGPTTVVIQKSPGGNSAFVPTTVTTVTVAGGSYEASSVVAFGVATGDVLRPVFSAVGANCGYDFQLEGVRL